MIQPGKSATVTTTVTEANTAKAVGSGNLNVFSTPMMIALMEQAACECLSGGLEDGQSSVGTKVDIVHTAASPLGANISATATVTAIDGKKISFSVTAKEGEKEIGKGSHERFIIDVERFISRL